MGAYMTDISKQLAEIICSALVEAKLINETSSTTLKQQILSGKTKPENWTAAIEKSMNSATAGDKSDE
jgi:hypothetical protein